MDRLTTKQKEALDDMVMRRVLGTDETQSQAAEHIANYLAGDSVYTKAIVYLRKTYQ